LKQTIFVSSVQKELATERKSVRDFVRNDPLLRQFFDVFLFEDIPAGDRRADEVYLSQVDRCGVYLGLYGMEYGSEDRDGCSPTEREFNRSTEKHKPRYIFVKGSDDRKRHPKMAALIRKAGNQLVRRRFTDVADLKAALYASLVDHLLQAGLLRTKPFDASACLDATIKDLSKEKLVEFLERARAEREYALGPTTPMSKALAHLNLMDGNRPNHAAILLLGLNPQRFLITSEVKCMHFHGTEVRKPIPSYHIYKGTVFELVDQAVDFVMSKIDRAVIPRDGKVASDEAYELPWRAVREAIVNAVMHRDYTSNASVQVMLFADRLEVWNPGELPPSLTLKNIRKPHASIPRNPLIAEPMFLTRYAEKAGSGILDMIDLCHEAGLPDAEFRQDGGQFVQTLRRKKVVTQVNLKTSTGLTTQSRAKSAQDQPKISPRSAQDQPKNLEQRILVVLVSGSRSASDISKSLKQKPAAGQFKLALRSLLSQGAVGYTIPSKPRSRWQRYQLTSKGRKLLK